MKAGIDVGTKSPEKGLASHRQLGSRLDHQSKEDDDCDDYALFKERNGAIKRRKTGREDTTFVGTEPQYFDHRQSPTSSQNTQE